MNFVIKIITHTQSGALYNMRFLKVQYLVFLFSSYITVQSKYILSSVLLIEKLSFISLLLCRIICLNCKLLKIINIYVNSCSSYVVIFVLVVYSICTVMCSTSLACIMKDLYNVNKFYSIHLCLDFDFLSYNTV
jgi:hypothetical protein